MLDLIVKFFPWDCILWTRTMQEKKKFVPSIIWPGLQTGKNLSFLGVWLYLPVSIMSLWLLIRIFTNSFWASAVTGRIPEGCKWPLARAEISKWKKKERKRERSSNKVWLRFILRVVHCIQKPFSVLKFKSIRW